MRVVWIEEWQRKVWKGLIAPWRDKLPLREQRVRHLMLSDWMEEVGFDEVALHIRWGRWCVWWDWMERGYAIEYWDGLSPVAPYLIHFWPRAYNSPAPMELADLDDCLLDSELWTQEPHA